MDPAFVTACAQHTRVKSVAQRVKVKNTNSDFFGRKGVATLEYADAYIVTLDEIVGKTKHGPMTFMKHEVVKLVPKGKKKLHDAQNGRDSTTPQHVPDKSKRAFDR